jgi:hypothetical protein
MRDRKGRLVATIRVTGWKAVAVLVLVAALGVFRFVTARDALDADAQQQLGMWLRGEYASRYLAAIRPDSLTPEQVQDLLRLDRIEFPSIRGIGTPDDMVVRVEITVDGGPPPDGRAVRYWRMRYSTITGWRMEREANALLYYLNVF